MKQIRSFIAIELPEQLKQELVILEAELKDKSGISAKWVDPYSIHLTIKFLGNVSVDKIDGILSVMEKAVTGTSPFSLQITGLGAFPNLNRVQVAWVGLAGELNKLAELQKRLESGLVSFGFPVESRAFKPHLTLARVRDRVPLIDRQRFGRIIAETGFKAENDIKVASINLMKSELTREGAIYSCTGTVALSPEPA